jgi:hypothetical protein
MICLILYPTTEKKTKQKQVRANQKSKNKKEKSQNNIGNIMEDLMRITLLDLYPRYLLAGDLPFQLWSSQRYRPMPLYQLL